MSENTEIVRGRKLYAYAFPGNNKPKEVVEFQVSDVNDRYFYLYGREFAVSKKTMQPKQSELRFYFNREDAVKEMEMNVATARLWKKVADHFQNAFSPNLTLAQLKEIDRIINPTP